MYSLTFRICELDPAKVFSVPRLARQAALKTNKLKLDLLADTNIINGKKRYHRSNISRYSLIYKS